jgi:hypothetical protein
MQRIPLKKRTPHRRAVRREPSALPSLRLRVSAVILLPLFYHQSPRSVKRILDSKLSGNRKIAARTELAAIQT